MEIIMNIKSKLLITKSTHSQNIFFILFLENKFHKYGGTKCLIMFKERMEFKYFHQHFVKNLINNENNSFKLIYFDKRK